MKVTIIAFKSCMTSAVYGQADAFAIAAYISGRRNHASWRGHDVRIVAPGGSPKTRSPMSAIMKFAILAPSCISESPSIRRLKRDIVLGMTNLLDQAIQVARSLPSDAQDDIARVVLQLAGMDDTPSVALSSGERAAIEASKDAAARGEFATDEQVRAAWAKHGL
jgi:hypothetical protein